MLRAQPEMKFGSPASAKRVQPAPQALPVMCKITPEMKTSYPVPRACRTQLQSTSVFRNT